VGLTMACTLHGARVRGRVPTKVWEGAQGGAVVVCAVGGHDSLLPPFPGAGEGIR
jgi:hypothetical protein